MNTKNLLLLVCILGFSSLAFAGIDVSIEKVDADGQIVTDGASRLLPAEYGCTMILYSKANIQSNGGLLAVLNIFGPPYDGAVDNLDTLGASPSYFHNLHRIVYQGAHCDCTVSVFYGTEATGKSKDYYSVTSVDSSAQTKIDLDWCSSNNAASLVIQCSA